MNGDIEVGEVGMTHSVQENIVWLDVTGGGGYQTRAEWSEGVESFYR